MAEPLDMSLEEFRALLDEIGWSVLHLSRACGVSEPTARRWGTRRKAHYAISHVPPEVQAWLQEAAAWHRAHPVPQVYQDTNDADD